MTILQDVGSESALLAQIAELRAQNEILKAKAAARASSRVSFKVSEKGALSIYGLGRFPVTLYLSQFRALDGAWATIRDFVDENESSFAVKE